MQELILIRGLPGSGKSTFAKKLRDLMDQTDWLNVPENHCDHFEADMFFIENGEYKFDPNKVVEAHKWCKDHTEKALDAGHSVIVSNTFSRLWEMQWYIAQADIRDIKLTVLTCEGNFRNVHDVPEESIERMRKRWEKYNG